jgi:hypothetical protein
MNISTLLPQVRRTLLIQRAQGSTSFGLSWLAMQVSPELYAYSWRQHPSVKATNRSRFTSGSPKEIRGKVQRCLVLLAVQGMIYTRRKPEGGVMRYEHGERDKYFHFRITKEQALAECAKTGVKIPVKLNIDQLHGEYLNAKILAKTA